MASSSTKVLSVVLRMDGRQFAGATQLVSASTCNPREASDAATSMARAVGDQLPETGRARIDVNATSFAHKEFRTATKLILTALANSLQQALPEDFNMAKARPPNLLLPSGPEGTRLQLSKLEMEALSLTGEGDGDSRHFVFNRDSHTSLCDFYEHDDFFHLCLAADEGTEVGHSVQS